MELSNLHDWVFNYNSYKKVWNATKREYYTLLFSGGDKSLVLSSSRIDTLIELIAKTNGDKDKLNKIVKGGIKHVIVE